MRLFFASVLSLIALVPFAFAKRPDYVSPWVPFDRITDLRTVDSQRLDTALKLALVKGTKKGDTIDIATYDQRYDETFTLPLLSGLRDAANRGVKIRFLVSWFPQKLYDNCWNISFWHCFLPQTSQTPDYLLEVPTKEPIQYMIFGGSDLDSKGWSWFDAVHEKLFIINDQVAITGGRPMDASYSQSMDTTFILKGPLVPTLKDRFGSLWNEVLKQTSPKVVKPKSYTPKRMETFPWEFGIREKKIYHNIIQWIAAGYDPEWLHRPLIPGQPKARVLHHDFVRQMNDLGEHRKNYMEIPDRLKYLFDPILDAVIQKLENAKSARIIMLNGSTHPLLLQALKRARWRGADISVFFNQLDLTREKDIFPFSPVWIYAVADILQMLENHIDVWKFVASDPQIQGFHMPKEESDYTYLHRKLVVIDDTVFIGSHNMNAPSTFGNDELTIEIEDPSLAHRFSKLLFDDALETNGEILNINDVRHDFYLIEPWNRGLPDGFFRIM